MTNADIIRRLRLEARTLADRGENLYRVRAYRQAAFLLSQLAGEVSNLSPEALRDLGLGKSLARTVATWAAETVEHSVS